MSYAIDPQRPLTSELRRVAGEQLERTLELLDDLDDLDVHDAIHEARKRFKKVRALLRLFRDALGDTYGDENAWLRDTARAISELRDAQAHLETLDALAEDCPSDAVGQALTSVRDALETRRDRLVEAQDARRRLAWVARRTRDCLQRCPRWSLSATGFAAIESGLQRTYRRARRRRRDAFETGAVDAFHTWRKRAKYHRYHVRLLEPLWPASFETWEDELHTLTDLLGDLHDLAVLRSLLVDEAPAGQAWRCLLPVIDARQAALRAPSRGLGARLLAERPPALVNRLGELFAVARGERRGALAAAPGA